MKKHEKGEQMFSYVRSFQECPHRSGKLVGHSSGSPDTYGFRQSPQEKQCFRSLLLSPEKKPARASEEDDFLFSGRRKKGAQ